MLIKIVNDTVEVRNDDAVLIASFNRRNSGLMIKSKWIQDLKNVCELSQEYAEAVIFVLEQTYGKEYFKSEEG